MLIQNQSMSDSAFSLMNQMAVDEDNIMSVCAVRVCVYDVRV